MYESVLRRWIKQLGSIAVGRAFKRPLKKKQSQEIERLKRELVRVKTERDIIKRALSYLAKDPS